MVYFHESFIITCETHDLFTNAFLIIFFLHVICFFTHNSFISMGLFRNSFIFFYSFPRSFFTRFIPPHDSCTFTWFLYSVIHLLKYVFHIISFLIHDFFLHCLLLFKSFLHHWFILHMWLYLPHSHHAVFISHRHLFEDMTSFSLLFSTDLILLKWWLEVYVIFHTGTVLIISEDCSLSHAFSFPRLWSALLPAARSLPQQKGVSHSFPGDSHGLRIWDAKFHPSCFVLSSEPAECVWEVQYRWYQENNIIYEKRFYF